MGLVSSANPNGGAAADESVDYEMPTGAQVYAYRECRLMSEYHGLRLRCLSHTSPRWETARALGAMPPCLVDRFGPQWIKRVLHDKKTVDGETLPKSLQPLVDLSRAQLDEDWPDIYRNHSALEYCAQHDVNVEAWQAAGFDTIMDIERWHAATGDHNDAAEWVTQLDRYYSSTKLQCAVAFWSRVLWKDRGMPINELVQRLRKRTVPEDTLSGGYYHIENVRVPMGLASALVEIGIEWGAQRGQ